MINVSTPATPPAPDKRRKNGLIIGCCVALLALFVIGSGFIVATLLAGGATLTGAGQPTYEELVVREGRTNRKIVIIDIHGVIFASGAEPSVVTADSVNDQIAAAETDPDVVAIILDIDSPGGSAVGSTLIYDALRTAEKPIIALFSGEVAASGAVYAAVGSDWIVSQRETLTGSIGVILETIDLSALLATYGVKFNTIKSGEFKDIGSFSRPITDEERTMFQDLIDESYAGFVAALSAGRSLTNEQVRAFADGRVFSGTTAKTLGLVDELGNLDTAIAAAERLIEQTETQVVRYQEPFSFESLFSFFSSRLSGHEALAILEHLEENPELRLMYILE